MFGLYRLILSLSVVQAHLWQYNVPSAAWYAVFSFYTLSGFLMTHILNETYGFSKNGLFRFVYNRFLRLYPTYYAISALALLHIIFIAPLALPSQTQMPTHLSGYLTWITIIGHTGLTYQHLATAWKYSLNYNAWSLNIEIVGYIMLALYFAKTKARLWGFLAFGIACILLTALLPTTTEVEGPYGFQHHYGVIQAGFIPFAMGGLCYFYKPQLKRITHSVRIWQIVGMMLCNVALGYESGFHKYVSGLYIASFSTIFMIAKLHDYQAASESARFWDDICGKLAYPIFISHWTIAGIMATHMPWLADKSTQDFMVFIAATLLFSGFAIYCIEAPINRIRIRIRPHSTNME